jgi:hypothetical protein
MKCSWDNQVEKIKIMNKYMYFVFDTESHIKISLVNLINIAKDHYI